MSATHATVAEGPALRSPDAVADGVRWNVPGLLGCTMVAAIEGFDLATVGISGPGMAHALGLGRTAFGVSVTAVMAGFLVGALAGGRLGDRFSRRNTLLVGMVIAAVGSALTARAAALQPLLALRLLTGIGIGLVYPNFMALAAASVPAQARARAIAIVACGGSVGGLTAGLLLFAGGARMPWQGFFVTGAAGCVAVLPFVLWLLPSANQPASDARPERASATGGVLFGGGRAALTLLVWSASFLTAFVYYLVANWMPSLMAARGMQASQVGLASALLSTCAIVGGLVLASVYDRRPGALPLLCAYAGMAAALSGLAGVTGAGWTIGAVAAIGLFVFGGQMLLQGLPAYLYPSAGRATGIGWAQGAGRLGAIASPVAVGAALDAGLDQRTLLAALVPVVLMAGCCAMQVARSLSSLQETNS